ncbi:hypothetical protein ACFQO4_18495 [Saliphagus sp. GCM10025334]
MKEVTARANVVSSPAAVCDRLTPEAIIDYMDSYSVGSFDKTDQVFTVANEKIEMVLEFERIEDGYRYEQRKGQGPFEEMLTEITVDTDEEMIVTRSRFTFGGIFSFIIDWLAMGQRQHELEKMLINLVTDEAGGEKSVAPSNSSETDSYKV